MTAADSSPTLLGAFIRAQRQMANLSLRQLSALTEVSNPYLSQIERGLHEPSLRVLKSIAEALNVSAETLFEQAGLIDNTEKLDAEATEQAIRQDRLLTEPQRRALLSVYRSYVEANTSEANTSEANTSEANTSEANTSEANTEAPNAERP